MPKSPFQSAALDHIKDAKVVIHELEIYLESLKERHEILRVEMQELTQELLLNKLQLTLSLLQEKSTLLDSIFYKIDQLQQTMDQINELILTVFAVVKGIDNASDIAGKASSLFASFGININSERANAGLWSRIPIYAMFKRRTAREFLSAAHDIFTPLCIECDKKE